MLAKVGLSFLSVNNFTLANVGRTPVLAYITQAILLWIVVFFTVCVSVFTRNIFISCDVLSHLRPISFGAVRVPMRYSENICCTINQHCNCGRFSLEQPMKQYGFKQSVR